MGQLFDQPGLHYDKRLIVLYRKPFMISKDDQLKPMGTKSIILRMPFMVVILASIAVSYRL